MAVHQLLTFLLLLTTLCSCVKFHEPAERPSLPPGTAFEIRSVRLERTPSRSAEELRISAVLTNSGQPFRASFYLGGAWFMQPSPAEPAFLWPNDQSVTLYGYDTWMHFHKQLITEFAQQLIAQRGPEILERGISFSLRRDYGVLTLFSTHPLGALAQGNGAWTDEQNSFLTYETVEGNLLKSVVKSASKLLGDESDSRIALFQVKPVLYSDEVHLIFLDRFFGNLIPLSVGQSRAQAELHLDVGKTIMGNIFFPIYAATLLPVIMRDDFHVGL